MICEDAVDQSGPEMDLQCREHVTSDTEESEVENNALETSDTGRADQEPCDFSRHQFGSPSALNYSTASAEITHRPKAIKPKYVHRTESLQRPVKTVVSSNRAAIVERDARSAHSDMQLFVNAPCGPAGPVFTPTGGAFKSMPSPKVSAPFDYKLKESPASSPSAVRRHPGEGKQRF